MGFEVDVRLGLKLGPRGYAARPVELGAAPRSCPPLQACHAVTVEMRLHRLRAIAWESLPLAEVGARRNLVNRATRPRSPSAMVGRAQGLALTAAIW